MDAAIAAPGAIAVMLWNSTSRSPTASRRKPVGAVAVFVIRLLASARRSGAGCGLNFPEKPQHKCLMRPRSIWAGRVAPRLRAEGG
jgi:hypothetical protein